MVPVKRGSRAVWENFGAAREAASGNYDVWLSTAHAVPFRAKIPTVAIIHDMIPLLFPEFQDTLQVSYLRFALLYVAKKADRIITNSRQTKADIERFAKIDPAKIVIVPFGSGSHLIRHAQDLRGVEPLEVPHRRFLLTIGTLEPRKNLKRLFQAFSLLGEPEFADVGLVVAGGRGWKEDGIFAAVEDLKIADRITFLGYVPDEQLADLFRRCAGFIFPTLYEGFGMPIVESMNMGCPVLTSQSGAMAEVSGNAAVLFDPYDPADMACKIKQFLSMDEVQRDQLVDRGHAQARQFNWTAAAEETHQVLRNLAYKNG